MAKQLNVNLAFTADTNNAKMQLQDLQKQLTHLMNMPLRVNGSISDEIREASLAAADLKVHLEQATNLKTGTLDFTKLNDSLKKSGTSLSHYGELLVKIGADGQKAFMTLTQSVMRAEVPIRRSNALLTEMWTTLKNTARWQLSSSILHGFMGTLSSAYGYAQDLNESLNNIRIVTGYSKDEMAAFAEEANKAARALSTTTTEYTNASLIYYQQGLSAEEVQKRTNITVKMANVARQSAEVVSDQMTAVWNNFYDGTKSLEYYADVMTALGAKTASSTDEIAGGLEKFAAIGNTIGLSYEYAASALATITSNTRQSEEVVGTALKTIFARIQGLNLGETLDDGTTLNKYSEALEKVGISIFDQTGELKTMDAILDEMGSKWESLNAAQQTALAQTVAGVRQYTQLISLMENWNSGDEDSFQANLNTARTSSGALNEQYEVYAEGWEAASDRVRTAFEDIYQTLLDDDAFIGILNTLEKIVNYFDLLIDNAGGLGGVLTTLGAILTRVFSNQLASTLSNMVYSIKMSTASGQEAVRQQKATAIQDAADIMKNLEGGGEATTTASSVYTQQLELQQELIDNQDRMNEGEAKRIQLLMDQLALQGEQTIEAARALDIAKENTAEATTNVYTKSAAAAKNSGTAFNVKAVTSQLKIVKETTLETKKLNAEIDKIGQNGSASADDLSRIKTIFDTLKPFDVINEQDISTLEQLLIKLGNLDAESEDWEATLNSIKGLMGSINTATIDSAADAIHVDNADIQAYADGVVDVANKTDILKEKNKNMSDSIDATSKKIKTAQGVQKTWADHLVAGANVALTCASALQSLGGMMDTLQDPDISGWEKFITIMSTLGMVIPMVVSTFSALGPVGTAAGAGAAAAGAGMASAGAGAAGAAPGLAGFGVALNAALGPVGWIILAVTALTAAIVGIGIAASNAYNKDAIEAKKAAEAAEDLAESHEEAKQTLTDLQSAFSQYDEAVAALEACTEGTEEWNTALEKVNETVLNLMNEYPSLLKDADVFTRNEITGMLELNREKQQEILDELEKQVSVTQASSMFGAAHASEAAVKSDKTNITRSIGNMYNVGQVHSAGDGYVYYDDIINVGTILTDNALELADLTETEYREKVSQLLRNAANDQAKSYSGFDAQINNLVDKCVDYQFQIDNLADNTEAAANQMANAAQLIADQNLGDEYDSAEKTMAGYALEEREDELKTALKTLAAGNSGAQKKNDALYRSLGFTGDYGIAQNSGANNDIYKFLAKQLEQAGTGYSATTGNTVQGSDKNRTFVFQDAEGNKVTKTADWVAETIATSIALQELGNSAEEAQASLNTMETQVSSIANSSKAADSQTSALRAFISSKNFDSSSMADFSALTAEVAEQGGAEAYVKAVFGQNGEFTNTMAKKYGYETAEEFINAFNTKLTDMESAWDTIELPADLLGTDELSFTAAKALHDIFYDIDIGPLGERAGEQFTEGLNKMLQGVKAEDQTAALNALANVDWSSWDALDQASAIMADYGVNIDVTSNYWKAFADNMRKATVATPDFTDLQERLTSIAGILHDLDFGSIIEQEDYDTLIAYNAAWKDFFIMQADGSRKFIGNSKMMLQSVVDETSFEIKALEERKKVQDSFKAVKWGNAQGLVTDWSTKSGAETGTARNLMNAGGGTEAALELLGYTDERIAEIIAQAESTDETIKTEGQDALAKMYDKMQEFLDEGLETTLEETYEQIASLAPDISTLKDLLKDEKIDKNAYDKQLKALLYAEIENAESYEELQAALKLAEDNKVKWAPEDYADKLKEIALDGIEAATSIQELGVAIQQAAANGATISFDDYKDKLKELALGNLEAAASLTELQTAFESSSEIIVNGQAVDTGIDYQDFADNLIRLGEAYDNCAKEVEDYRRALANGDSVDEAEDALEASILLAEAAEEYGFQAKELEVQSRQLAKAYNLTAAAAAKLAVQNQRMNKGIVTLAENWEDWNKVLSGSDKDTTDFAKAIIDCTAAVADLVGASSDLELPDDFFDAENLALLEKAINGDITAINQLGIAVAQEQIKLLEWNGAFAKLAEESLSTETATFEDVLSEKQFDKDFKTVYDTLEALRTNTLNTAQEMDAGWVAALNRMALATGMSVDDMNELLGSMGVQAKVDVEYVKQPMEIPTYTEVVEKEEVGIDTNGDGKDDQWGHRRYTIPGEPVTVEGYAAVAQISTEDHPLTVDVNEGVKPSGGSSGGGGSGATYTGNRGQVSNSTKEAVTAATPKPAEAVEVTKIEDVVDRYKELDDALEGVADAYSDAAKAADRLYGNARIKKLEEQNQLLLDEIELLKQKAQQAKSYLAIDKLALQTAASNAGINLSFNEDGTIGNYTSELTKLYNELATAQNDWNASYASKTQEEQQAYEENVIKPIEDKIAALREAIAQYDATLATIREIDNSADDKFYEWQSNNYEQLSYKLEVDIDLNDAELKLLDLQLNRISDDLYSVAEAMTILTQEKIPLLNNALSSYGAFVGDLKSAYEAGEISMADYQDGLSSAADSIYSNIEALQELDEQMMNYYGETLGMVQDELSKYNSLMEHSSSVLDHYYNIVEMINGDSDYDNLNIILQGQADVAKNQMEVAKATYEMYKGQEEYWRSQRDSVAEGTDAWNFYNDYMLQTAESAAEAEEEMLAATETWAQKMKDIMVNTFEKSKWDVEKSLTRGIGFDNLMSSMDRLSSLSDEYLTKTNQIYEMQTIQNKLQKEIDKTSNVAAKERLKNFKQDTAKLQEKNQLSKYELELHQAKYDVLLAEIALEEAQNAKSTVRLQRDSEGNFGYVYTADANKVADAEQNLLDARNKEYNISLEAANDYAQKIIETQQSMYDDLNALYEEYAINGRYTEEEYNQIKEQIISEYNEKFKAYSVNYTLALAHDTDVQKDAWTNAYQDIVAQTTKSYDDIIAKEISTYTQMSEESNIAYTNLQTDAMNAYASMTQSSTDWSTAVTGHLDTCEQAYTDWRTTVSTENETIQKLLGDVKGSVDTVTTANTLLRDTVVDNVVPKVESALSSVAAATVNYMSNIRQQVLDTIAQYEALIRTILEYQRTLAASKGPGDQTPPDTDLSDLGNVGGGGNTGGTGGTPGNNIGHNEMAQLVQDIMVHGSYQNDPVRTQMILNAGYTAEQRADAQAIVNDLAKNETNAWHTGQGWEDALNKYVSKYGYNTGGYTGSWGPDGRLGVLHQKEIVLNSDDTENFLAAINLVRDITKMIDLEVMRSQMSAMSVATFGNGFGQGGTLDQNVHIEASFPNVQDHREIEEAINNLINTASQFAYRQ